MNDHDPMTGRRRSRALRVALAAKTGAGLAPLLADLPQQGRWPR